MGLTFDYIKYKEFFLNYGKNVKKMVKNLRE